MNYKVSVDSLDDSQVDITIWSIPTQTFSCSREQAGGYLYWVAENITSHPYRPFTFKHNHENITLDYRTALNLYFALLNWSQQFHHETILTLENELDMIEDGHPQQEVDFSEFDEIVKQKYSLN